MSQFTLSLFRRLKAVFGPDADVGFREQGYLIMAAAEQPRRCWPRTWRCSSPMAPTSSCWRRPSWRSGSPGSRRTAWRPAAFGRSGEGWFDPPSLATLLRNAAKARGVTVAPRPRHRHRRARRPHRGGAAGERRQHRLRRARQRGGAWAGELAALAGVALPVEPRKRYVYVIDCREATEALHRAPLTVDPSGVWFRPEGRFFLCGKSPEEDQEPPATRPRRHRSRLLRERGVAAAGGARAGLRERQGGERLGRLLRLQHARPERRDRPASRGSPTSISPTASPATAPSRRRRAGRAVAELIVHGAFQTIDLTRLGYARIAERRPLLERNVI